MPQADPIRHTPVRWNRYKKGIERQFHFFGIIDSTIKKEGLLIRRGDHLIDSDNLSSDPNSQGEDMYKVLIRKIGDHIIPKKKKDCVRFQLRELKQQCHEQLANYYARVREIAKKCGYVTRASNHAQKQDMHQSDKENSELDKILTEAAFNEQTTEQAKAISKKLNDEQSSESIKKIKAARRRERKKQYLWAV